MKVKAPPKVSGPRFWKDRVPMADRWSPGISIGKGLSGPMQAVGGLFAM